MRRSGSFGSGRLLVVGLVVAALGLGVASLVVARGPEATKVRAVKVDRRDIKSRVLAQGKVRARRQVEVGSEISGRVVAVFVEVGDRVEAGAPLFSLDDEQLKNAVRQLRVALGAADALVRRATLLFEEARQNLERDRKLAEKGLLASDALRASEARAKLAEADLEQAKAQLERARLDLLRAEDTLAKAQIVSPMAGTVVEVGVEVGQVVAPVAGLSSTSSSSSALGLPLAGAGASSQGVVLADLSELLAHLDVDELDIARVRPGMPVRLSSLGESSRVFEGEVLRVGLLGREVGSAVQFPVEASLRLGDAPSALDAGPPAAPEVPSASLPPVRPGMSVSAEIEVERLEDVLAVPVAAVLEGDGRKGGRPDRVWRIEAQVAGKTAREVPVVLGPTDGKLVAVLDGLEAEDLLVEGPFRALRTLSDGDPVDVDEEVPLPGALEEEEAP